MCKTKLTNLGYTVRLTKQHEREVNIRLKALKELQP